MTRCFRWTLLLVVVLAVSARADDSPILALDTARIGPFDARTTVTLVPHPDNLAVCVGLTAPREMTRWACRFIPEVTDTTLTINWVVPEGTYRVDTGLWRAHRPTVAGTKVSLTFTRGFGKVKL